MAGLNKVCRLIRFSNPSDDVVGGSVPSGTVVYEGLYIRAAAEKPVMALMQQGLETVDTFSAYIFPGNIVIEHNDQIQFTAPVQDWYYGKKFRVVSIQRSSNGPFQDRNTTRIVMRRWEESRSNDLQ